ncbi:hypothetical protein N8I77_005896 [Diaporthe amygdali]|uniref:Uncharacterized protein n=1 Tax=Phomopsis amygdali TaxID=1214568 RepID=A0AAD9SGY6_PHOAM|nr:hypothetical protein N8I77_005896 [Diaporthe amygdali]
MALRSQWTAREVIDLTGDDDDDDVVQPVQPPPPAARPQHTGASSIANGFVNGAPLGSSPFHGNTHAHPYPPPLATPAPVQPLYGPPAVNTPSFAPSRPAKRQKLSEPPRGTVYSEEQLITLSIGQRLSAYARDAVEIFKDEDLDKDKLRREIQAVLADDFGAVIRKYGRLPDDDKDKVTARALSLVKNYAVLPGFRRAQYPNPLVRTKSPAVSAPRPLANGLPSPTVPIRTPTQDFYKPTSVNKTRQHLVSKPLITEPTVAPATQPQDAVLPTTSQSLATVPSTIRPRTPPSPKRVKSVAATVPTSPANYRSRAKIAAWKSNTDSHNVKERSASGYFALEHRPYRNARTKQEILKGNGLLRKMRPDQLVKPHIFHVDFTLEEARKVQVAARKVLRSDKKHDDPYKGLAKLLKKLKRPEDVTRLASQLKIEARSTDDLSAFLSDILQKKATTQDPRILSVEKDVYDRRGEALRDSYLSALLMAREVSGNRFRTTTMRHLTDELRKSLEDGLELRSEFTNCAGDISAVSWVSNSAYIAGTTVHMDSHNQQYNKPGNLLLGSVAPASTKLTSYPDHRIPRPIVQKGENSTDEMRESQDPWLYTSVVSSDYDSIHDRTYTSGFDRSAKVWRVDKSGSSMQCIGSWTHDGIVNFVQASPLEHPTGLVATAADVPTGAVRIYTVNPEDVSSSTYMSFSATRVPDSDGSFSNKWTYFPSTMKWGVAESVRHLLLVGFSPRSLTEDENDIPEDRMNTGELCLWDGLTGQAVHIPGANSQNVFEVLWHPYLPEFVVASSPAGDFDADIRTQVRIFVRDNSSGQDLQFKFVKSFDCTALDINELTIMPNSTAFFYITAGCTDGKTYVWDSAQHETLRRRPIHVLAHDRPLEGITVGDNEDDTGVKFTAWAASLDRFYTGSSDGVVKVWNIRGTKAKGRVILEAPAQISHGAFSPDFSKLVIGDASGRVFVLSVGEDEEKLASFVNVSGPRGLGATTRRRPTPITPHPEPPPPRLLLQSRETSSDLGHAYVNARQLRFSGDPTVGMVQDVNYADTGLFRRAAHAAYDPTRELMAYVESEQQTNRKMFANAPIRTKRIKKLSLSSENPDQMDVDGGEPKASEVARRHRENCKLDLDFAGLSLDTLEALERDGVPFQELRDGVEYYGLEYVDEVDENLKQGVVDRKKEDEDGMGF